MEGLIICDNCQKSMASRPQVNFDLTAFSRRLVGQQIRVASLAAHQINKLEISVGETLKAIIEGYLGCCPICIVKDDIRDHSPPIESTIVEHDCVVQQDGLYCFACLEENAYHARFSCPNRVFLNCHTHCWRCFLIYKLGGREVHHGIDCQKVILKTLAFLIFSYERLWLNNKFGDMITDDQNVSRKWLSSIEPASKLINLIRVFLWWFSV